MLGVPSEHELNEDVRLRVNDPAVINVANELPMPRLLALLERAAALVSVDTGPAHAAAALGLPQVVLFGAADPFVPAGLAPAPPLEIFCV